MAHLKNKYFYIGIKTFTCVRSSEIKCSLFFIKLEILEISGISNYNDRNFEKFFR